MRGTTMLIKQWRVGWQCAPNCQIHGDPSICDAGGRVGTGTMLWECGIVLGKYLEKCPEALRTVDAAAASRERSGWNRGKNHGRRRRARAGARRWLGEGGLEAGGAGREAASAVTERIRTQAAHARTSAAPRLARRACRVQPPPPPPGASWDSRAALLVDLA